MPQMFSTRAKVAAFAAGAGFLLVGMTTLVLASGRGAQAAHGTAAPAHAWKTTDLVEPANLAKELDGAESGKPTVVCVGFPVLYRNGHVPGAPIHGPARTADSLADLRAWATDLPRTTNLVIYCGCCPMTECPNVSPAFAALREMGFTHVRILDLPKNFATDWIAKGYPIEKTAAGVRK
ncbi:MAG TPA: rhodanese-like domain-containing protein [Vicinamibacterales bacterium]